MLSLSKLRDENATLFEIAPLDWIHTDNGEEANIEILVSIGAGRKHGITEDDEFVVFRPMEGEEAIICDAVAQQVYEDHTVLKVGEYLLEPAAGDYAQIVRR